MLTALVVAERGGVEGEQSVLMAKGRGVKKMLWRGSLTGWGVASGVAMPWGKACEL